MDNMYWLPCAYVQGIEIMISFVCRLHENRQISRLKLYPLTSNWVGRLTCTVLASRLGPLYRKDKSQCTIQQQDLDEDLE